MNKDNATHLAAVAVFAESAATMALDAIDTIQNFDDAEAALMQAKQALDVVAGAIQAHAQRELANDI